MVPSHPEGRLPYAYDASSSGGILGFFYSYTYEEATPSEPSIDFIQKAAELERAPLDDVYERAPSKSPRF